jgi:hypothetical protein
VFNLNFKVCNQRRVFLKLRRFMFGCAQFLCQYTFSYIRTAASSYVPYPCHQCKQPAPSRVPPVSFALVRVTPRRYKANQLMPPTKSNSPQLPPHDPHTSRLIERGAAVPRLQTITLLKHRYKQSQSWTSQLKHCVAMCLWALSIVRRVKY